MLIERKDRWKEILYNMMHGSYYGADRKDNKIKNRVFLTFMGRKLSAKEASVISGLSFNFFKAYKDKELPLDDLVNKLDERWVRQKNKILKQGLL